MKEQYNTIEWNVRRLQILVLDDFTCVQCGSNSNLQVHHKKYDNKLKVWEYPDQYLVTVCHSCHNAFHNRTPTGSMYEKIKKKVLDKKLVNYFKILPIKIPKGVNYIPLPKVKRTL